MTPQVDWNHISEEETCPSPRDLILGDQENGVTRQMEYNVYDTGEEQMFQFGSKVRVLTSEDKTCEWPQPTLLIRVLHSGVILLESIRSGTLEHVGDILSCPNRLSDHEREAVEFL